MKAYLQAKEISYNAIFFSAFKALIVFEQLLESPKTFTEIQDYLINLPYIKSAPSKDTLRVYINTFKSNGCKVTKELSKQKRREYRYFIPENPFHPRLNEKQANRFFEIFDIILYNLPITEIINLEVLTRKLNQSFKNEHFSTLYYSHSPFKDININILKELEKCCTNNDIVTVLYKSPRSGNKEIKIASKKILIQNHKVYLQGFGFEYKEDAIFLLDRILEIKNVEPYENYDSPQDNTINVIYELYDSTITLLDNETLIDEDDTKRIINHKTNNKVLSNQHFLQLAENCKIIAPLEYQKEFIKILKNTHEEYLYARQH